MDIGTFIIFGLALVVLAAVTYFICFIWKNFSSVAKFRKEFKFTPSGIKGAMAKKEQEWVDVGLSSIARILHREYAEERKLTVPSELSVDNHDAKLTEYLKKVDKAKKEVQFCKKWFWEAHGLAKKHGFAVGEKYSDYLPK